jgi:hypothetical protein
LSLKLIVLICKKSQRKTHNEELHDLYSPPNIGRAGKSRRMRWTGHVACMVAVIILYKVLVGISEGNRPPGRHRHEW